MAERKRRPPLLDAFGFAAPCTAVHPATLEPLAAGGDLAATPLPATSRTHPERQDLTLAEGCDTASIIIRSSRPARRPANWVRKVQALQSALTPAVERHGALLLPSGSPVAPWGASEPIPGCLQRALRLDLHFDRAEDFGRLHAAVRLVLPLIPAIAAATPMREGRVTGILSNRLRACLDLYDRFPERVGGFIPEAVFDQAEHDRAILGPIARSAAAAGRAEPPDPQMLNLRAATAHFEQGILSIHAIDAQENSAADMAVLEFIIAILKALVGGRWVSTYLQRAWGTDDLAAILLTTIHDGTHAIVTNRDYLLMFGLMKQEEATADRLLQHLFVELYGELSENARVHISLIIEQGCLAERLSVRLGHDPGAQRLREAFAALAACRTDGPFR